MSSLREHERDDAGSDGAPDAKRQRVDDQEDVPDPHVITIVIKDHVDPFKIDKEMAMTHSVYFERIMSGPWANARTGVVELEEGDHASPYNVDMFIRYVEYAEDPEGEVDPLDEINDFNTFAKLWLFADYIQSNTLANAIMDQIAGEADGSDGMLMSKEDFMFWWNETDARPSFANLRGIMVAMLVESGNIQDDTSRHELMPLLPADAQQAIVDELMRQHRDVKYEIEEGAEKLRDHLSAQGRRVLNQIRTRMDQKVVGEDYHAAYGN
ncbi:hypothetical protein INS49_009626 [Diaporthe citri]|uniref:uncharacterized protein n=1 Tax=Diaporthe citri TaxID=83186 RepID=UPI001C81CC88|nr:uncharacterized protein INS49_009626 [Diaporthe citri]KAG6361399.1 hypothetical protein INS49_009626 [Diaporthe citri]